MKVLEVELHYGDIKKCVKASSKKDSSNDALNIILQKQSSSRTTFKGSKGK